MKISEKQLKRLINEEIEEAVDFAKIISVLRVIAPHAGNLIRITANIIRNLNQSDKTSLLNLLKEVSRGNVLNLFTSENMALLHRTYEASQRTSTELPAGQEASEAETQTTTPRPTLGTGTMTEAHLRQMIRNIVKEQTERSITPDVVEQFLRRNAALRADLANARNDEAILNLIQRMRDNGDLYPPMSWYPDSVLLFGFRQWRDLDRAMGWGDQGGPTYRWPY